MQQYAVPAFTNKQRVKAFTFRQAGSAVRSSSVEILTCNSEAVWHREQHLQGYALHCIARCMSDEQPSRSVPTTCITDDRQLLSFFGTVCLAAASTSFFTTVCLVRRARQKLLFVVQLLLREVFKFCKHLPQYSHLRYFLSSLSRSFGWRRSKMLLLT